MTITDYLPRLGLLERTHRRPKHSAPAEVERLRAKLAGAELLMADYRLQLDDKERELVNVRAKQGEAEEIVVQQLADIDDLKAERDELLAEVLKFRARFGPQLAAEANAHRITVPQMVRDTSAIEDQATGPIDVRTLWAARDAGLLGPVTNPGHVKGDQW